MVGAMAALVRSRGVALGCALKRSAARVLGPAVQQRSLQVGPRCGAHCARASVGVFVNGPLARVCPCVHVGCVCRSVSPSVLCESVHAMGRSVRECVELVS